MHAGIQIVYSHYMLTSSMECLCNVKFWHLCRRSLDRMNDRRTNYSTKNKCSLVQWISIWTAIAFLVRKNWTPMPRASGSYGRQASRQAGRWNMAGFKIFKILYRLNYLNFYFVDIIAMLLIALEVHFSLLFSNKAY